MTHTNLFLNEGCGRVLWGPVALVNKSMDHWGFDREELLVEGVELHGGANLLKIQSIQRKHRPIMWVISKF